MRRLMIAMAGLSLLAATAWCEDGGAAVNNGTRQTAAQNYELKGDIAKARGDFGAAQDWYEVVLGQEPKNAPVWNKLGITELKLGDTDGARKAFQRATKLQHDYPEALNNLGAAYCLERKYKPATKYLKQSLALDEPRAAAHLNLAEAWMGQKKVDRAMMEYARALELDADILNSATNEGMIAQVSTPEQRALITFLIARAYARRGNLEGALVYLRRAKELRYAHLGSVYSEPEFAGLWKDPRLLAIVKPRVD